MKATVDEELQKVARHLGKQIKKLKETRKKYWYLFDEHYCPICDSGYTIKTRMTTPKPKHYQERHVMHEKYDYCKL